MPKRTIKHKVFAYYETVEEPSTGRQVRVERFAARGQTVDLSDADAERGDRLGSFKKKDEDKPEVSGEFNAETASLDECVAWIEETSPNVQETVDASNGDLNTAKKLLDAEAAATGGEPRVGVQEGLTAVIQRGNE